MKDAAPAYDSAELSLGIAGFTYADLYEPHALARLTTAFHDHLAGADAAVAERFAAYRACGGDGMSPEAVSEVLVDTAPWLGRFVARLFRIEAAWQVQHDHIRDEDDVVLGFRNEFVAPLAKAFKNADTTDWDRVALEHAVTALRAAARATARHPDDDEYLTARAAGLRDGRLARQDGFLAGLRSVHNAWSGLADDALLEAARADLARWCHLVRSEPDFDPHAANTWIAFKEPARTDVRHLVHHPRREHAGFDTWAADSATRRRRDGFSLTDPRMPLRKVLYEVDHCIYCHDRDNDTCAKGMPNKKEGGFKTNALGVPVTGCPLGEKISEMHLVKRRGDNIGALALVVIDNPMCPGTGHRICNDCMKGCIYQKTEPVNIPQIETNVLTEVLALPWGYEIYALLTRWNPLNIARPHMLPYNGKKVLVAGLGPAGYTLAHYLLNEGFAVAGIDALKLEPLPAALTGSLHAPPQPVRDFR
ncbi:MAG: pyridine nucleotide-disulfide oxidoreductase, partial [Gammaproteobacteria bacterium]